MPATLTVDLETAKLDARLELAGIPATAPTYTIERASVESGNTAGVRGAVNAPTGGDTSIVVRDYEAPFNLDLVYTASLYDVDGAVVETVSVPFRIDWEECESWLVDLARPTNSLPLVIQSMTELTYDMPAGVHRVLGRRAPVLSTLPAWTPSTELIVLTDTLSERDQVRNLLGTGYPLLLRTSPDLGIGNLYLGVTAFVEERFLPAGVAAERRFRAQCVQVERPDPETFGPVAPNTWANVKATYPTWADVKAGAGTWEQLAYTYPDTAGAPVVPWLPDDV